MFKAIIFSGARVYHLFISFKVNQDIFICRHSKKRSE
jgi:hypothetical protein